MIKALMQFAPQYENEGKFQILEDVTPNTTPQSPILSSSPGLFFDRLRRNSEEHEYEEEEFSPCSTSTPEKSAPTIRSIIRSRRRLNLNSETITSNTQPSKRPLKRKGLAMANGNVAPTNCKRFRFEEHCVDYEKIEQKRLDKKMEEGLREDDRISSQLENRLNDFDIELDSVHFRLTALESVATRLVDYRIYLEIEENMLRRRALRNHRQFVERRIEDFKWRMRSYKNIRARG